MSALHIEAPVEKNSKGSPLFLYLIILSLIVLGVVSVRFFFGVGAPSPALPMEIANFAGKPQFYSAAEKRWRLVSRSDVFRSGDQLITAGGEEVDLKVTDLLFIRLKENSLVMNGGSGYVNRQNKLPLYRLNLEQGVILGTTVKDFKRKAQLLIGTPDAVLTAFDTTFEVRTKTKHTWMAVLAGVGEVRLPPFFNEVTALRALRKTDIQGNKISDPVQVSREEWDHMKEAYELIPRGAAHEAEQMDLAKKAGSLYDYVFDHGTFYTPDIGYALRDFALNETTGRTELNLEYDVFPRGSYVGMYMKIRDLDLSKFSSLEMDVRIAPDADELKEFQIELKSKGAVVRRMAAKVFTKQWKTFSFPFQAARETPIQEINFLFSNEKVGDYKKGVIQVRNINLVPKKIFPLQGASSGSPDKEKVPETKRSEIAVVLPETENKPEGTVPGAPKTAASKITVPAAAPATSVTDAPVPAAVSQPVDSIKMTVKEAPQDEFPADF